MFRKVLHHHLVCAVMYVPSLVIAQTVFCVFFDPLNKLGVVFTVQNIPGFGKQKMIADIGKFGENLCMPEKTFACRTLRTIVFKSLSNFGINQSIKE